MDEKIKYKIIAELENGASPKELVGIYDVSYPTILKLRKEYKEAKSQNTVDSVIAADKVLVARIADEVEKEGILDLDKISEFTDGIDAYSKLAVSLQKTAQLLIDNIAIEAKLTSDLDKIEQMTRCIATLQNSFFNKGITNLNVLQQQNITNNNSQVSTFKSLKRA